MFHRYTISQSDHKRDKTIDHAFPRSIGSSGHYVRPLYMKRENLAQSPLAFSYGRTGTAGTGTPTASEGICLGWEISFLLSFLHLVLLGWVEVGVGVVWGPPRELHAWDARRICMSLPVDESLGISGSFHLRSEEGEPFSFVGYHVCMCFLL